MRTTKCRVMGLVLFMSLLSINASGCSSGALNNRPLQVVLSSTITATAANGATTQQPDTGASPGLSLTPTATSCQRTAASDTTEDDMGIAPPYEEITATLLALRGNTPPPLTQKQQDAIRNYQDSIMGKQVDGWIGWAEAVTPEKAILELDKGVEAYKLPFTMWIVMDDPSIKEGQYTEVMLHGLSRVQAQQFHLWDKPIDEVARPEKVRFSGCILGVYDLTIVAVTVSQVELVK